MLRHYLFLFKLVDVWKLGGWKPMLGDFRGLSKLYKLWGILE